MVFSRLPVAASTREVRPRSSCRRKGDFIARVESLGISFMLDMSGEQKAQTGRNAALVPGNVRVVGMLLTR